MHTYWGMLGASALVDCRNIPHLEKSARNTNRLEGNEASLVLKPLGLWNFRKRPRSVFSDKSEKIILAMECA